LSLTSSSRSNNGPRPGNKADFPERGRRVTRFVLPGKVAAGVGASTAVNTAVASDCDERTQRGAGLPARSRCWRRSTGRCRQNVRIYRPPWRRLLSKRSGRLLRRGPPGQTCAGHGARGPVLDMRSVHLRSSRSRSPHSLKVARRRAASERRTHRFSRCGPAGTINVYRAPTRAAGEAAALARLESPFLPLLGSARASCTPPPLRVGACPRVAGE
jgi:hypothetical protein